VTRPGRLSRGTRSLGSVRTAVPGATDDRERTAYPTAAPQGGACVTGAHDAPSPGAGQVLLHPGGSAQVAPPSGQLAALYRLSDPGLSELSLEPLLDELLRRVREILDVDTVAVLLLEPEGTHLRATAAKGIEEEVEQGVRVPVGRGFAGRIAAHRAPVAIHDLSRADVVNPILRQKGICSMLGVPLIAEGRLVGVLHVGSLVPREFDEQAAALLEIAAVRVAPAIERAQVLEALEHEHRGAVALQRSLLPGRLPQLLDAELFARYLPSRDLVGGDWYDVIELADGRIGLAIGDVAGHGVRAATLMGQLRTGMRAYALEHHSPAEVLGRVDQLLHSLQGDGMATAGYGVVDLDAASVRFAWAGHPPPLLISAGRTRTLDVTPAPPLGVVPFARFPETEVALRPDDAIVLYTDGLVERRGESLEVGLERLAATADELAGSSIEDLTHGLVERLVGGAGTEDDIAILAMRVPRQPSRLELQLPADPSVLAPVRRVLRRWLAQWDPGPDDVFAITLATAEACSNAVEHAHSPGPASFALTASHENGMVTVTVADRGAWRAPRGRHRGRGLALMHEVMNEVDVERSEDGSTVRLRRRLGR
jgi:serine phosphatase RsbU (regulator of sigma subunit)/anti-sigma regulatory factor (Ser/Thr protein kinase)